MIHVLNPTNFQKTVLEEQQKPVFVTFTSTWCHHCKAFDAVFRSISKTYGQEFIFGSVNLSVVANQALATRYEIKGTPMTLIFFRGEAVGAVEGFHPEQDFVQLAIQPTQEQMAKIREAEKKKG